MCHTVCIIYICHKILNSALYYRNKTKFPVFDPHIYRYRLQAQHVRYSPNRQQFQMGLFQSTTTTVYLGLELFRTGCYALRYHRLSINDKYRFAIL